MMTSMQRHALLSVHRWISQAAFFLNAPKSENKKANLAAVKSIEDHLKQIPGFKNLPDEHRQQVQFMSQQLTAKAKDLKTEKEEVEA